MGKVSFSPKVPTQSIWENLKFFCNPSSGGASSENPKEMRRGGGGDCNVPFPSIGIPS